ncbi:hypothetical protein ACHAQJ_006866 [Trichoderma viride]
MGLPPPLPPRDNSQLPPPPPYSVVEDPQFSQTLEQGPSILQSKDPRYSPSQSLAPSRSDSDVRRTLLLVYIHGFYGNDQSFQSFPAHVHNFLREAVSETHTVHSKVYPRYKTYKSIDVARDNFSAWLEPHESPTTDVVLIGHSMGGLLAAEIVLMPNQVSSSQQPLKHRILGSLSLDSPFLGLHPGIVASGISSLFQAAPASPSQDAASPSPRQSYSVDLQPSSPNSFSNSLPGRPTDPNFDPPFFNDTPFREQPFLTRMFNFGTKHWSEGIFTALGNHVASHLEFGGCLADYRGLISRYNQLRALEDVDDLQASSNGSRNRIRFVNYYTLSPGRPKPPTTAKGSRDASRVDLSTDPISESKIEDEINKKLADVIIPAKSDDDDRSQATTSLSKTKTPAKDDDLNESTPIYLKSEEEEESIDDASLIAMQEELGQSLDLNRLSMQELDPVPMDETEYGVVEQDLETAVPNISDRSSPSIQDTIDENKEPLEKVPVSLDLDLPPIPDLPSPPEQPDLSQYTDKDARKQAEKEFGRLQKAYENAAKDRSKAVREREKLVEKLQKKAQKDAQKDAGKLEKDVKKQQQKDAEKLEKEIKKQQQKSEQDKRRLEKEEEKAAKAEKKRLEKEAAAAAKQQLADETKRAASLAAASSSSSLTMSMASPETEAETPGGGKPKKLGKFCTTPRKTNGVMDPTWVSVYMDGMDEVTAHCALFFPGPHYDTLVSAVGGKILGWVQEDLSVKAMLDLD